MDAKFRCQSCGMPISKEVKNFGTNADGLHVAEFCVFCFADGDFTAPNQTLGEMIASSIENMTTDLQMPLDQASELAHSFIPKLKSWQKS